MGKFDFEVQVKDDAPDAEAQRAPVPLTRLQILVTRVTLAPLLLAVVVTLAAGLLRSHAASSEIDRSQALAARAAGAIAPFVPDLNAWAYPPDVLEMEWRAGQSRYVGALSGHRAASRILIAVALLGLFPAFVIWNRGQFGRPDAPRPIDLLQVGLCAAALALLGSAWLYDAHAAGLGARIPRTRDLGETAAALVADGKADALAPWRGKLYDAVATLRQPVMAHQDPRRAAEMVSRMVGDPQFALLGAAERIALRRELESLAHSHYEDNAFEPLARALRAWVSPERVEEMLAEHARDTRAFAGEREMTAALFDAIRDDSEADVRAILRRGVDVNATDPRPGAGETALHAAVRLRHPKVADTLLGACARTDLPSSGETPLHAAIGEPVLVKTLLDRDAKPDARNAAGQTAMHLAAARGDRMSIKLLAARGADVNALDRAGRTPLDLTNDPAASDASRGANSLLQELGALPSADLKQRQGIAATPMPQ
jgi:hypothetical protein